MTDFEKESTMFIQSLKTPTLSSVSPKTLALAKKLLDMQDAEPRELTKEEIDLWATKLVASMYPNNKKS